MHIIGFSIGHREVANPLKLLILSPEERLFLTKLLAQRSSWFEILADAGFDLKSINDAMQFKGEQKLLNYCSCRVLCCLLKQRDRPSSHEKEYRVQLKPSL